MKNFLVILIILGMFASVNADEKGMTTTKNIGDSHLIVENYRDMLSHDEVVVQIRLTLVDVHGGTYFEEYGERYYEGYVITDSCTYPSYEAFEEDWLSNKNELYRYLNQVEKQYNIELRLEVIIY